MEGGRWPSGEDGHPWKGFSAVAAVRGSEPAAHGAHRMTAHKAMPHAAHGKVALPAGRVGIDQLLGVLIAGPVLRGTRLVATRAGSAAHSVLATRGVALAAFDLRYGILLRRLIMRPAPLWHGLGVLRLAAAIALALPRSPIALGYIPRPGRSITGRLLTARWLFSRGG